MRSIFRTAILLAAALCLAAPLAAQIEGSSSPIPERRALYEGGVDFYGGDIRSIFDTTLELCERSCLEEQSCRAFTFNIQQDACFLKTGADRRDIFDGALSAVIQDTPADVVARGSSRAENLSFLPPNVLNSARTRALRIGKDYSNLRNENLESLREQARNSLQSNSSRAKRASARAAAFSDQALDWRYLASATLSLSENRNNRDRYRDRRIARDAAINAYLRSNDRSISSAAMVILAKVLEADGFGRESIPALRIANSLSPSPSITTALNRAVRLFGFRVTDTRVESNAVTPRVCLTFSEPLRDKGFDYAPFLRLPAGDFAAEADGRDLCISGAAHGSTLNFTMRQGMPSQSGEALTSSIDQSFYIRDRDPSVRFLGRTYVLPASAEAAIPLVSVNTSEVELEIFHVEDRNLSTTLREGLVNRPLQRQEAARIPRELGESVWKGMGDTAVDLNKDVTTSLALGDAVTAFEPGVYALTARVPDSTSNAVATQWFVVTDLGLATMEGSDGVHVFVRSLATAQAKEGIKVALLATNNAVLGTATTDAQGYARFDAALARGTGGRAPGLIEVREGEQDFAYLSLSEAGFDLSDRGVEGRASPPPIDLFIATDRGAYRPGERVAATILARDARAVATQGLPLTAKILRPDGVEHAELVLADTGGGGRVLSLDLPHGAQRGSWKIAVYADTEAPRLREVEFLVEDFVPERIDFTLDLANQRIRLGDTPLLAISARYLYGAPGADLTIEGETLLRATQTLPAFPGYRFGPHDVATSPAYASVEGQPKTDPDGTATLPLILARPEEALTPFEMTAQIRLSDSSRRVVERSITAPVSPDAPLIGIRPLFDGSVPEGGSARFTLIAIDGDGQRTDITDATWELARVDTNYQWYEVGGRWRYDPVIRRSRVANGEIALAAGEDAALEMPVEWGQYQLTVSSEAQGFAVSSMVFSAGFYSVGGGTDTPDRLQVSLDKPVYAPGETARLRYTAETDGQLLIAIASDRLIDMQTQSVSAGTGEIVLDVTEAWHPGAYVTATLIRPLDGAAGTRAPVRALGVGWVGLEPGAALIRAYFTSPEEAAPRKPMQVSLQTDAPAGSEVWATIAATDLGILNLTGHQPPDPAGHYLGQRKLGMEFRDLYGRLIDPSVGTPSQIRSGGDGQSGGMKSPPPTEALLAFFTGPLKVADDGTVTASFDLPDFNGTVRVSAILWSTTAVGAATQDVLVRDPVVVSAAMPRFLAPGDAASLALDIANVTGPEGDMTVRVQSAALALDSTQSIALASGARGRLTVPLAPAGVGDAAILVTSTLSDGTVLTKNLTLGIRRNDPEISRQSRFTLAAGTGAITLDSDVFTGLAPGTGRAVFSAGPLARFDVPGLLSSLDRYPWGCTEQVTSRALPLLYFQQVASGLGLEEEQSLDDRISEAVTNVLSRQRRNGSFGLWQAGGSSDLWLDAYVSDFLTRARAEGHTVPDLAFEAALRNLQNRVNTAPDFEKGGEGLAYALYVLAREGQAAIGDLRYYADTRANAFATPLAQAQLGAALASYGDPARSDAMFRLASRQLGKGDDTGWRSDYGSHFRDRAAVLALASEAGSEVIDAVAYGTAVAQTARQSRYRSTQEQMWTLMAARALIQDAGNSGLTRDGVPVTGPLVDDLSDTALRAAPVTIANTGNAETDVVLTVFGIPTEREPASGNGYKITRVYYDLEGRQVDLASVALGARLVAVISVTPERNNEARLMVEDPLPAGFEIESPNLLGGSDIAALDWLQLGNPAKHSEFGTDRFRAAVDWKDTNTFRLGYILRAVSPGSFYHPAASVEDMYRPAYRARTGVGEVRISAE